MSVTVVANPDIENKSRVLLLHGWGYDHRCWEPLLPLFNKLNLTPVLVDLEYAGETAESLIDQLAGALIESVYVVGWSLGGMLGVQLAERYPEKVRGLITLAANAKFVADEHYSAAMPESTFQQFYDVVKRVPKKGRQRFSKLQVHGGVSEELTQWVEAHLLSFDSSLVDGLDILASIDNRQVLTNLKCPVLALFADEDALVPVSVIDQPCFTAPTISLHSIKNCGHLLHSSSESAELIESFLMSLEAAHG